MPGRAHGGSRSLAVSVLVCGLAWLGRVGAGLLPLGPLTVVRHAPPAVPPYSTQINIFRWLAAFPPPVLHRALVLTQGLTPPLHHPGVHHPVLHHPVVHHPVLHHPVVHHTPLAPPPPPPPPPPPVVAPALPPPPPPLVPVVKTPPLPAGLPTFNLNSFPPEALPFPPSIISASAFLPLLPRGIVPLTPILKTPLPLPLPLPTPTPLTPSVFNAPGVFNPNILLSGPALPPVDWDLGLGPGLTPTVRVPASPPSPAPVHPGHLTPSSASLAFHNDHPVHLRHYLPSVNGITRATAGNLAL